MRLEVEELDACDHPVGVRIRGEGSEERNGLTGKRFRLVPAPSRRGRPHGDRDGRIHVVRRNGYLRRCGAGTGRRPTASSEQKGAREPGSRRSPHCWERRRQEARGAVQLRGSPSHCAFDVAGYRCRASVLSPNRTCLACRSKSDPERYRARLVEILESIVSRCSHANHSTSQ